MLADCLKGYPMLIHVIVLAALASSQAPTAVERFAAYMKRADALTVKVRATTNGTTEVGEGTLEWRRPVSQRFEMKWGPERFEFRQNPNGMVAYLHERRYYQDYDPTRVMTPPPGVPSYVVRYGYPYVLLSGDLRPLLPANQTFKPAGTTTIGSVQADVVSASFSQLMAKMDYSAAIDSAGRLLRFSFAADSPQGAVNVTLEFSDYKTTAPGPADFAPKLPWGYVPLKLKPQPLMPDLGQALPLGRWTSSSGKKVDVAALAKGRPLVVLFTQEGCALSRAAEKAFRALRQRLEEQNGQVVEVVLGAKKAKTGHRDPKRMLFVDPDRVIEREFGVPGAPYLVLFGADGKTSRAWYGFDSKQPMALVEGICSGLPVSR